MTWKGHTIVTRTADGIYRIGNSMPPQIPLDFAHVQVFETTGPFPLIDGPGVVNTIDAEAWMSEAKKGGFSFTLLNEKRCEPQSPLAKLIDPGKTYSADAIAGLFKRSPEEVRQWWKNWHSQLEPRLNSTTDSNSREPTSTAYHLLEFLYRYERFLL